jgi:hypothetical protein
MSIETLRHKHKTFTVEHAFRVCGLENYNFEIKNQWVEYLISGGSFKRMLEELRNGHTLPPLESPAESQEFKGFIILDETPDYFYNDQRNFLCVTIKNESAIQWETSESSQLFLSYRWYLKSGVIFEPEGVRTAIPKVIMPNKRLSMCVEVLAPKLPAIYLLEITMLMEGKFWLDDRGLRVFKVPIKVDDINSQWIEYRGLLLNSTLGPKPIQDIMRNIYLDIDERKNS